MDEFAQELEGLRRRLLRAMTSPRLAEGLGAERVGQHEEVHQAVDGDGRNGDEAAAGEREQVVPGRWELGVGALQQVGPIAGDGRCGIDGERVLMAVVVVAGMRLADGVRGLIGEEVRGQMLVEREQKVVVRGLADGGMVDDHQVEAGGEVGERRVGELLQRALVPGDRDVGMKFREALRGGDHREDSRACGSR